MMPHDEPFVMRASFYIFLLCGLLHLPIQIGQWRHLKRHQMDLHRMLHERFSPVVKTVVPMDGRFEYIVLSCKDTSKNAINWIKREAQRALDIWLKSDRIRHQISLPLSYYKFGKDSLTKCRIKCINLPPSAYNGIHMKMWLLQLRPEIM